MKLELRDAEGLTGVFIEVPLEQLKAELGSGSSSAAADPEADAKLKESQDKVVELEEKMAGITEKTMDGFTPEEKAGFVITWARGLAPEDKAIFAEAVGIPLVKVTEAEVAEAEAKGKAEGKEVELPWCIQGKTDRPGYRYLPTLNLSIKEA